jgi:hypothetical protein
MTAASAEMTTEIARADIDRDRLETGRSAQTAGNAITTLIASDVMIQREQPEMHLGIEARAVIGRETETAGRRGRWAEIVQRTGRERGRARGFRV